MERDRLERLEELVMDQVCREHLGEPEMERGHRGRPEELSLRGPHLGLVLLLGRGNVLALLSRRSRP